MIWDLQGYAWAEDKEHCEEYGRMLQADPSKVSQRAKKRGLPQVPLSLQYVVKFVTSILALFLILAPWRMHQSLLTALHWHNTCSTDLCCQGKGMA